LLQSFSLTDISLLNTLLFTTATTTTYSNCQRSLACCENTWKELPSVFVTTGAEDGMEVKLSRGKKQNTQRKYCQQQ
jgi:hypothetical protein